MTYFDSFGFDHIPKEIKKNIKTSRNLQSQQMFLEFKHTIQ